MFGVCLVGGNLKECGDDGRSECRQLTTNVAGCCAACAAKPGCTAFTFRATERSCWLKDKESVSTIEEGAGAYYSAAMASVG